MSGPKGRTWEIKYSEEQLETKSKENQGADCDAFAAIIQAE